MSETEIEPPAQRTYRHEPIELRIRADLTHLPVIRSVVGSVAAQADFDLDTIADLRLAVDEACSTLIDAARGESTLVCRFSVDDDVVLRFDGAVPSARPEPPSTGSFGWQILTTLTSSAATWLERDNPHGDSWLHIEITKAKAETGG